MSEQLEPLAYTTTQAGEVLGGISRPTVYALIRNQGLPWFKCGTRTLIPAAELKAWVSAQAEKKGEILP